MAKTKLRELGMDPMERLYYERKDRRKRAYDGKRRKAVTRSRRMPSGSCQLDGVVTTASIQKVSSSILL